MQLLQKSRFFSLHNISTSKTLQIVFPIFFQELLYLTRSDCQVICIGYSYLIFFSSHASLIDWFKLKQGKKKCINHNSHNKLQFDLSKLPINIEKNCKMIWSFVLNFESRDWTWANTSKNVQVLQRRLLHIQ